jgi:hypothetical protein
MVHPLVAGDGVNPSRQGLVTLVGVAFLVNRQQGFLHEVLHVAAVVVHAPLQEAAQVSAQAFEQLGISGRIPRVRTHPQSVELDFELVQGIAHKNSSVKG